MANQGGNEVLQRFFVFPTGGVDAAIGIDGRFELRAAGQNLNAPAVVREAAVHAPDGAAQDTGTPGIKTLPAEFGKKSLEELFIAVERETVNVGGR